MNSILTCVALSAFCFGCVADDSSRAEAELQTAPDPSASYRVVVSLSSLGAGIDHDAYNQISALFGAHDIDLSPDVFAWGLEGEQNLCFDLVGLDVQAQALFVDDLEGVAASSPLVTVYENAACNVLGAH